MHRAFIRYAPVKVRLEGIVTNIGTMVNPFQVGSEIISPRPYLFFVLAETDSTIVSAASNCLVGVYASLVTVEVVRSTEPLGPGTAWHSAMMRLCVPLLVFSIEWTMS